MKNQIKEIPKTENKDKKEVEPQYQDWSREEEDRGHSYSHDPRQREEFYDYQN